MKVSASFLGSRNIVQSLMLLNDTDVDYIHVDVMDGKFVSNKTMPFKEMRNIYKYTSKRLDVHLMVDKPSKYIRDYVTLNTEYLTIHLESKEDIKKNLELIKTYGVKCGLSIRPDTPVYLLEPYLPLLDIVLVMTVEPGKSGQAFMPTMKGKVEMLKNMISNARLSTKVSVDGGITDVTKNLVSSADILVSGSYIIDSEDYQQRVTNLRN